MLRSFSARPQHGAHGSCYPRRADRDTSLFRTLGPSLSLRLAPLSRAHIYIARARVCVARATTNPWWTYYTLFLYVRAHPPCIILCYLSLSLSLSLHTVRRVFLGMHAPRCCAANSYLPFTFPETALFAREIFHRAFCGFIHSFLYLYGTPGHALFSLSLTHSSHISLCFSLFLSYFLELTKIT